jgi:multicomponent Na+:H+ antiporter subunit D
VTSLVPLVVLLPLLGAAAALGLAARPALQRAVTITALVATLGVSVALLLIVDATAPLVMEVGGWPTPFGIVLVVDRLSALMLVVSAAVLLAVLVFSTGQGLADDAETPVSIFHPGYLVLAAGVMNAFVAGDLFNLYVGFEMLLVASYVLITLGGTEMRIRAGVTYVITSLLSSVLFLASIGIVYGAVGTVNIAQMSVRIAELPQETQTLLHTLLLVAFGIKAAVFPLSFWLPDSYPTAPAPVTAVFAGLLTKVGVYAILRTETILFPTPELNVVLLVIAALTMVVGILGAVAQSDIKRLLSFTLVSHIGYMIMGVGLGTAAGVSAAVYYIVHHIVVQTTLFLAAGLIERVGGSTAIGRLGGLLAASPVVAVLYFVPALNLGGIPPFSGFIGKLGLFVAAAERGDAISYVLMGAGALVSLLTLFALMRVWSTVFWRSDPAADEAVVVSDASGSAAEPSGPDAGDARAADAPRSPVGAEQRAADARVAGTDAASVTGALPQVEFDAVMARAADPVDADGHVRLPRVMVWSTAAMVAFSVALTVFAGPLYGLATRAGENLQGTGFYVEAVLGDGAAEPTTGGIE